MRAVNMWCLLKAPIFESKLNKVFVLLYVRVKWNFTFMWTKVFVHVNIIIRISYVKVYANHCVKNTYMWTKIKRYIFCIIFLLQVTFWFLMERPILKQDWHYLITFVYQKRLLVKIQFCSLAVHRDVTRQLNTTVILLNNNGKNWENWGVNDRIRI